MKLDIFVDNQQFAVTVPDTLLHEAQDFFARMDADMDRGWQMSREWVAQPNSLNRCQIAANKLLTAMENENDTLATLMAAYILQRAPGTTGVRIDAEGEMLETALLTD